MKIIRAFSTCSEFTEGMIGVASRLLQLKEPPGIVHQVLFVLRVHSVHLPVLAALIKQWAQEELCKPTDSKREQLSHRSFMHEGKPALYDNSLFKDSRKQLDVTCSLVVQHLVMHYE